MKPKFGVVVFPGSNCDHDAYFAVKKVLGFEAEFLWHKEKELKGSDVIILPGGFSYGDYLRTGAIARFSPIMESVYNFAEKGGVVIGICNGFQILLELGLLPGAMMRNESLKFVCKDVFIRVENNNNIFTKSVDQKILKIPVAHGEGNYFADEQTLDEIEKNGQVLFRYVSNKGKIGSEFNPNGSLNNIAGIINKKKNVMGLMPHPERCCDPLLGNTDGSLLFKSVAENL